MENIKLQITYRSTNYLDYGSAIRKTICTKTVYYTTVQHMYIVQFVLYKMYMYVCCMTSFSAKDSQKVDPLHDATSEKQSHAEAL
jgi:hypothetical protein